MIILHDLIMKKTARLMNVAFFTVQNKMYVLFTTKGREGWRFAMGNCLKAGFFTANKTSLRVLVDLDREWHVSEFERLREVKDTE